RPGGGAGRGAAPRSPPGAAAAGGASVGARGAGAGRSVFRGPPGGRGEAGRGRRGGGGGAGEPGRARSGAGRRQCRPRSSGWWKRVRRARIALLKNQVMMYSASPTTCRPPPITEFSDGCAVGENRGKDGCTANTGCTVRVW